MTYNKHHIEINIIVNLKLLYQKKKILVKNKVNKVVIHYHKEKVGINIVVMKI